MKLMERKLRIWRGIKSGEGRWVTVSEDIGIRLKMRQRRQEGGKMWYVLRKAWYYYCTKMCGSGTGVLNEKKIKSV